MTLLEIFGIKLGNCRRKHGNSQKELAEKLKKYVPFVTPSFQATSISNWECGSSQMYIGTLWIICQLYDIDTNYILDLPSTDESIKNVLSDVAKNPVNIANNFYTELGKFLAKKRHQYGFSQHDLSNLLYRHTNDTILDKFSPATISAWECGKSRMSIGTFRELCKLYKLDAIKLLNLISEKII